MPGPAVYSKWPFVGKRRADTESAPTEDVILEEAINKGRGRRKVAGGIYAAPTAVDFVGGGVPDAPRMGNPFISY